MGLLDDAIREHLDLKRRRGGDPTEIERAEREALGPVRRNRESAGEEEDPLDPRLARPGSAVDEPDEGIAADLADEEDDDDFEDERDGVREPEWEPATEESVVEAPLGAEPVADEDPFDDDPFEDDEPFDDDAPATRVMRTTDSPPAEERTAAYDMEDAFEDEPAGAGPGRGEDGEDVLEETPEFLQDTPDHDRLWFEQRPPRDFDFGN